MGDISGFLARLQPRRVIVLRASRIGDFICATPAFRALRAALPDAEITLMALPMVRDLVDCLPSLDRFLPFPGFPGMAEQFFDAPRVTQVFRRVQSENFDLALQMHGSGAYSNPFVRRLGARVTAGLRTADAADLSRVPIVLCTFADPKWLQAGKADPKDF